MLPRVSVVGIIIDDIMVEDLLQAGSDESGLRIVGAAIPRRTEKAPAEILADRADHTEPPAMIVDEGGPAFARRPSCPREGCWKVAGLVAGEGVRARIAHQMA